MNCYEVQAQLSAYLDGNSRQAASSELKQHLANCVKCGDALQQELAIRAMLREMRVPQPNEDFVSRSFQAAFSQHRVRHDDKPKLTDTKQTVDKQKVSPKGEHHLSIRQGFFWGFSSAAAVALMIWGVAAVMLIAPKENQIAGNIPATTLAKATSDIPVVKINLNGIQPVKLAFNTPRAVERAKISITLPDNVFLKGFPGEKNIVWETDLAAGDNTLSLPIVGKQIRDDLVQDFLIAKVSHKGGEQSLSLRLQVVNPGMSHYSSHARSSA